MDAAFEAAGGAAPTSHQDIAGVDDIAAGLSGITRWSQKHVADAVEYVIAEGKISHWTVVPTPARARRAALFGTPPTAASRCGEFS